MRNVAMMMLIARIALLVVIPFLIVIVTIAVASPLRIVIAMTAANANRDSTQQIKWTGSIAFVRLLILFQFFRHIDIKIPFGIDVE